ncbi:IPT/TIG domain-containing protein [Cupriavidus sp. USMAA2-4]|uniref:IPT/TIG domain-containing protein n=1 Tax=Cupriavidus sp. USMAA2-4 TaxID=876364 RepID=UPI001E623B5E|nr:IPT/TIG domain-containing protein [Cupriavidus sp. USMAA2-4]
MYARIVSGVRVLARIIAADFLGLVLVAGALCNSAPVMAAVFNFGYDNLGRLTGVSDSSGNVATYAYDAAGNITSIARGVSAVTILGFSPQGGVAGTSVTISGSGFSTTASQNTVQFSGTTATVLSASATQLVVQVPVGATTGPISVASPNGSVTSSSSFTISPGAAPTISGFTPTIGIAGTAVSVSGTNFQPTLNENSLIFNTRAAVVSGATTTALSTAVPASSMSGRVTITTPYGRATSTQDFFIPPPPHITADVVSTGRTAIGATQTVTVGTAGKIGLMLFDGSSGQRMSLMISSSSFSSCGSGSIQLLNPDGSSGGGVNLCSGAFLDTVTLPTTGTYTLMIAPSGADTGSVSVALYNVSDVSGTIAVDGASVALTTTVPGQNGSLTFSGTVGKKISLTTSQISMSGCYYLAVVNPDNSNLYGPAIQCGSAFLEPMTLPATGTYTIRLLHYYGATGGVTFNLYNVPPDASSAISIGGSSVTLTTTAPGQNGSLTFSGTAGQKVSLTTSQISMSGCYYLAVVNPDNSNLYGPAIQCGSAFLEPMTLPATGSFTIRLLHYYGATGSVTFNLYDVSSDASSAISIGGSSVTLTTLPGQNGRLTFSGTAGQVVSLTTSQISMSGCYYLAVVNPDNSNLYGPALQCGGAFLEPMTLPATGTYTVRLLHYYGATGSVTFNLYNVPPDASSAISIGGSSVTLTTAVPGQNGSLTFSGTAGQKISLTTSQSSMSGCYYLAVVNPDNSNLYGPALQCGGASIGPLTLPTTGSYTIRLLHYGSGTGSLTFTLTSSS